MTAMELKNARFEMFVEMAKKCESDAKLFGIVSLHYDGTDVLGNIRIKICPRHASEANEILKELLGY